MINSNFVLGYLVKRAQGDSTTPTAGYRSSLDVLREILASRSQDAQAQSRRARSGSTPAESSKKQPVRGSWSYATETPTSPTTGKPYQVARRGTFGLGRPGLRWLKPGKEPRKSGDIVPVPGRVSDAHGERDVPPEAMAMAVQQPKRVPVPGPDPGKKDIKTILTGGSAGANLTDQQLNRALRGIYTSDIMSKLTPDQQKQLGLDVIPDAGPGSAVGWDPRAGRWLAARETGERPEPDIEYAPQPPAGSAWSPRTGQYMTAEGRPWTGGTPWTTQIRRRATDEEAGVPAGTVRQPRPGLAMEYVSPQRIGTAGRIGGQTGYQRGLANAIAPGRTPRGMATLASRYSGQYGGRQPASTPPSPAEQLGATAAGARTPLNPDVARRLAQDYVRFGGGTVPTGETPEQSMARIQAMQQAMQPRSLGSILGGLGNWLFGGRT